MNEKYPLALPEGTALAGQYIIEKVLGQGGFGITYKAVDHNSGQYVAVKEFFPDSMATRNGTTVIPFSGERGESYVYGKGCFLQEAETLAQFIGNDNIVRIFTYFEENGTAYFVMEYVEGTSFDVYIREHGGRLSFDEAAAVLVPIMDALYAVHQKGIVHRDVTPDNIYITNSGVVKLLDFGAARYSLGDKSRSLDVVLKHGFAPKEQYTRRGKQGPFTDVYSLGATFYYAITGKRPPDSVERMDDDSLIPPSNLGANIGRVPEQAILNALNIQPQDRFQSMKAFKKAMYDSQVIDAQEKNAYGTAYYPNTQVQPNQFAGQNGPGYGSSSLGGTYGNSNVQPAQYGNAGGQPTPYGNSAGQPAPYGNSGYDQRAYGPSQQGGNRNVGPTTPYNAGQTTPYNGGQTTPYGSGGNQGSYPSGGSYGGGSQKKKTNIVPIIIIAASVLAVLIAVIIIVASKARKPEPTTVAVNTTTETTTATTETTTSHRDTVDPFPGTTSPTTDTTTETTTETTTQTGNSETYPEILGNEPTNLANMGLCAVDGNGQEYDADYKGQRLLKYVENGDDEVLVSGKYIWNLSIVDNTIYYIGGRHAYTCGLDGSNDTLIPELSAYGDVENLYVTKDYYFALRVDSASDVSRLLCVERGSGTLLYELKLDREYDSDADLGMRQVTFTGGCVYYLLTSADGITYDSSQKQCLWMLPAGDMANSTPKKIVSYNKHCSEITAEGDYVYYMFGDKGHGYGLAMIDIKNIEIVGDFAFDENTYDMTHMVVRDKKLAFYSENNGTVSVCTVDAIPNAESWTINTIKSFETDEGFWGLTVKKNGYYILSQDLGLQYMGLEGGGYTIISDVDQ